jgi:disulfide bond formation protein DsbB
MNDEREALQSQVQADTPVIRRADAWSPLPLCVAGLCVAAVAIALVSQYSFGMQPCPWCTFQRLLFLLVAATAGMCAFGTGRWWTRFSAGLALLFSAAGIASALWQHFVASKSESCAMTLADRILDGLGLYRLLPSVFEPKASCAEAAVDLLGLPYEIWSLGLFLISGGLMLIFLLKLRVSRAPA